jgi:hypothetical protein
MTKYTVDLDPSDIYAIRDALDLAHQHIMLNRILMRALGQPVSKGPGPLRRRITRLIKDFPVFTQVP